MKLRNKKTGGLANILADDQDFIRVYTDAGWHDYDSVAEMMEEWEDYKPVEPLIKDERVRKAVRAWAAVDKLVKLKVKTDYRIESVNTDAELMFNEQEFYDLPKNKILTITELCGEEEEPEDDEDEEDTRDEDCRKVRLLY